MVWEEEVRGREVSFGEGGAGGGEGVLDQICLLIPGTSANRRLTPTDLEVRGERLAELEC